MNNTRSNSVENSKTTQPAHASLQRRRNGSSGQGRFKRGLKKALGMLGASAVLASSLVVASEVVEQAVAPTPAHAAEPLICDGSTIYLQRGEQVDALDLTTTPVTRTQGIITGLQNNGLGITNGGEVVYSIQSTPGSSAKEIKYQIRDTGATGTVSVNPGAPYFVRGGVNPVNDVYYYANTAYDSANETVKVGAYRAPTADHSEVAPQVVAEISGLPFQANGDMAFSASGALLIVAEDTIYTIEGELPASAQGTIPVFEAKALKTLNEVVGNGIAFANNGNFFVSTSDSILEVNPASGVIEDTHAYSGAGFTDLASCAYPNTLSVKKNIEADRYNESDQFTFSISGQPYLGQNTGSVSATTEGTEPGLQLPTAGPEFVFQGQSFHISEIEAGTADLDYYHSSLQCVEAVTGAEVSITQNGSGAWDIDYPSELLRGADVVCTINNEAHDPSVELTKSTDLTQQYEVGEVITYTFSAENTGNVPLTGVTIEDELEGLSELTNFVWPGAPNELQPGEVVTAEATLTVTQAHVDAADIENIADVVGTPPVGDDVTDTSTVNVPFAAAPAIELEKTTDLSEPYAVGDTIDYSFVATNTGNVTLTDVTIADPLPGLSDLTFDWSQATGEGTLAPGEQVSATATLTVTQAHVNSGIIENTATAVGTPPTGEDVEDTSTVEVPFDGDPSIELTKSTDLTGDYNLGDEVTYTFVAENTGNVTLDDVTIADPLPGLSSLTYNWDDAAGEGTLNPGDTVTATATLTITQEHLDEGWVQNTATVTGAPPAGPEVTDSSSVTINANIDPAIELTKTGVLDSAAEAGGTVTFEFEAVNTGNVTLTDVEITDPLPNMSILEYDWTEAAGEGVLEPGQRVTATATYTLTQADVDAGAVVNLATATGTPPAVTNPEDPSAPPVPADPVEDEDPASVPLPHGPALQLVKTGNLVETGADATVGDTVEFEFVATNIGNVTLSDVLITDPLPGISQLVHDWSEAAGEGELEPGQSVTATATYVLTQADIDAGHVANTGSVTGTPPTTDPENPPTPIPPVEDETIVPVPPAPSIELVKTSELAGDAVAGDAVAGDEVEYTFVATNTGNTTLTDVVIADPLPGLSSLTYDWTNALESGVLEPGDTVTATASLTLTQAHIDNGWVENTATAEGTPPNEFDPEDPEGPGTPADSVEDDSTIITDLPSTPSIEVVKTSELTGDVVVGDEVEYTFVATNTGNVTLTEVTITDPLPGLTALTYDWSDASAQGVLEPGDTVTATATLTLTQAHIDNGWVENTASAEGTPPNTFDPEDPDGPGEPNDPVEDDTTIITDLPADPSIEVVKTGLLDTTATAGENVSYTFTATNTGNVTLSDVEITDPLPNMSVLEYDWTEAAGEGVLEPGQRVTATATYTLTQGDVDAGSVANLATAEGTPPPAFDPENPAEPGSPENPGEPNEPVEDEDPETVPLPQGPALQLVKTGSLTDNPAEVGSVMTFSFEAQNTGNVTLTDVTVTDTLPGISELTYDWSDATAEGTLAPGGRVTATATYALTQADIDAGHVVNGASVTGTPPGDPEDPTDPPTPIPPVEDETIVPVPPAPSIELVKTSELAGDAVAGDEVEYTFVATNTGNTTLTDVEIADPLPGLSELVFDWSDALADGTLEPGDTVTATATLTLTQAHIDNGWVENTATAEGTPPNEFDPEDPDGPGTPADSVEDDSTIITDLPSTPSIEIVKTSELQGDAVEGDEVEYTFVATNTGNVTLTEVTITDPLPGLTALTYDWSDASAQGVLEPGDTVTATATLTLTQAHVDNGWVENTASAEGTPPNTFDPEDPDGPGEPNEPVEDDTTIITELDPDPSIEILKTGTLDGETAAGETVSYNFTATNTGNVTLTNVTITDPLTGLSELTFDWSDAVSEGTLAPGEQVTATATYTLTQADVDAGSVANLATAEGTPPPTIDPDDPEAPGVPSVPVEDEDPETVDLPQGPALQLVKSGELANSDSAATVGDTIVFEFIATNIGNVTLTDVTINDPLPGLSELTHEWPDATAEGTLQPGQYVIATATYALTQADIDAGHVANSATAEGTTPGDPNDPDNPPTVTPPAPGETIVPLPPAPSIDVTKTSELLGEPKAGEVVVYSFEAVNTGNVTLTDVTITDPLPGLSALTYDWSEAAGQGVLEPGQRVTATASLELTQTLVDQGWVLNKATAEGTPPNEFDPSDPEGPGIPATPVDDESTVVTNLPPAASIDIVKTGKASGQSAPGDIITFAFTATNTGNVTLSNVVISDELAGISVLTYDWSRATSEGVLAPGEQVTATATYVITDADAAAGNVVNSAGVQGVPPATTVPGDPSVPPVGSDPVESDDTVTIPVGALAETGSQTGPWLMGIGGLMVAGGLLLLVRRNRKYDTV